jgi:hypothetical protein
MRQLLLCSTAALALACTKRAESVKSEVPADPLAGRTHHTIVHGGNLWGDLLECG